MAVEEVEEISSIIPDGPLKGASLPMEVWAEINGELVIPLDLEEIDRDIAS